VLGENPGKALKYPPADALTFATKYLEGGYTYVEVRKQPSKTKVADAVGKDPMVKAFEDLYNKHVRDIYVRIIRSGVFASFPVKK
jgi:hypothetical protein